MKVSFADIERLKTQGYFYFPAPLLEVIQKATGATYSGSLRLAQLYGRLAYCQRENENFKIRRYVRISGATRSTVQGEIKILKDAGWLRATPVEGGLQIECLGIPYSGRVLAIDEEEPIEWEPSLGREAPRKIAAISDEHRRTIIYLWNSHKPEKWPKLASLGASRIKTLEKLVAGNGGVAWFIRELPGVMELVRQNPFWSNECHGPGWSSFIGSKDPKGHFENFAERSTDHHHDRDKFEDRVVRDAVSHEWWPQKPNMTQQELSEAIENAERIEQQG